MTNRQQQIAEYMSLSYPVYVSVQTGPTGSRYTMEVIAWPECVASGATMQEASDALERRKRHFIEGRLAARVPIPMPQDAAQQSERFRLSFLALREGIVEAAFENGVDLRKEDVGALSIDGLTKLVIDVTRKQATSKSAKKGNSNAKSTPVRV